MSELHPLATAVTHPSPKKGVLPSWRIFAGLALAPGAYSVLIVAGYAVSASECEFVRKADAAVWLIVAVALLAILAGVAISLGNFTRTREEAQGGHARTQDVGDGRTRFLAYAGLCASGVFGLAAVIQLAAIVLIHRCVGLPVLP
jgi:hypothetical protein